MKIAVFAMDTFTRASAWPSPFQNEVTPFTCCSIVALKRANLETENSFIVNVNLVGEDEKLAVDHQRLLMEL